MTGASLEQCMNALELANKIRTANADLRREITELPHDQGCAKVADLLTNPSGPVASFQIGRLLKCIDWIGDTGMIRYLRYAGIITATKRVGALTPRQRKCLTEALVDHELLWLTPRVAA